MTEQLGQLNNVIETLPLAYARHKIITDEQNRPVDYIFLSINSAFEKMTGLERNKIIGEKVTTVLPGIADGEFDWIDIYGAVALQNKTFTFEQYADLLERWYEVRAYSDEPGYFTTVFNEITARKKELLTMRLLLDMTEKLLIADESELDYSKPVKALCTLAGAKFTVINLYENEGTIAVTRAIAGLPAEINRAAKLLGFELSDRKWNLQPSGVRKTRSERVLHYRTLTAATEGFIDPGSAKMLEEVFQVGDIYVIEIGYGSQNIVGSVIFFMPRGKVIANLDAIKLYIDQLGTVIEQKKAKKALKQLNRQLDLQVKEQTVVDAFTFSVSHDLRAPLRRVAGFAEALLEEHHQKLTDSAQDYLNRIHNQVQLMDELISAMLRLSEVAQHELVCENVNLSSLFDNQIRKLRYLEPQRQVKTTAAPGLTVYGDLNLLRIALENLVDNAWKFTADTDEAQIEFGVLENGTHLTYYIRDNGIGFDMRYSDKLFVPFHRLHQDNRFTGTAIGLNLVYRIMLKHGGEIRAESKPGAGATFFFTLPQHKLQEL